MESDDSSHYMVWLILGLIVFLILGGFVMFLLGVFDKATEDNECWTSITQHSLLLRSSENDIEPEIRCPTRYTEISKKLDDTQVNKKIANAWQQCWKEWHQGEAELFRNSGVYCHVCQIFEFEDRQQLNGMYSYLANQKIPGLTSDETYLEYLTPFSTRQTNLLQTLPDTAMDSSGAHQPVEDVLELTHDTYGIIIVYAKGKDRIAEIMDGNRQDTLLVGGSMMVGGSAAAAGVLAFAGPVGWVVIAGGVAVAGAAAVYTALYAGTEPPQWIAVSSLRPYDDTVLSNLNCEVAPVKQ